MSSSVVCQVDVLQDHCRLMGAYTHTHTMSKSFTSHPHTHTHISPIDCARTKTMDWRRKIKLLPSSLLTSKKNTQRTTNTNDELHSPIVKQGVSLFDSELMCRGLLDVTHQIHQPLRQIPLQKHTSVWAHLCRLETMFFMLNRVCNIPSIGFMLSLINWLISTEPP